MKNLYAHEKWLERRKEIIELDGFTCSECGRSEDEVVLQVHHKNYTKGKFPWEYAANELITLCKGCHAREHGLVYPSSGWEYVGEDDLEELIGACENCGTSIRYAYTIFHPNWETMVVGTNCCDYLTETKLASGHRKFLSRIKRFKNSSRWKNSALIHSITQSRKKIIIKNMGYYFRLIIDNKRSNTQYETLESAQEKAFEVIEKGILDKFLSD